MCRHYDDMETFDSHLEGLEEEEIVPCCGVCGDELKEEKTVRVNNIGLCHAECSPEHFYKHLTSPL